MWVPSFNTSGASGRHTRAGRVAFSIGGLLAALAVLLILSPAAEALPTPNLATIASASVPVGGSITDTALLGGGNNPGGTITFSFYGPTDTKCTATPVFTSTVKVGVPTVSGAYQPTAPGTYNIIAVYPGDANNAPVSGTCGSIEESVAVTQAAPTITTTASPSVGVGGTISDTAVLAGAFKPTGTVTFHAYGPGDTGCATPVFGVAEPVSASTVSAGYAPPTAGVYRWVASYSGDAANAAVASPCGDPAEAVTVTPGTTGPASQQPACAQAVAQAMATSVLTALSSALSGGPAGTFKTTCSSGVRIVLRAKEIRPGNKGYPHHDGYTTIANTLTHSTTTGQLAFSLNAQGTALRAYAQSAHKSLTVFAIVHIRPDHTDVSSEALQILTLG
jgi:hypothetical protein